MAGHAFSVRTKLRAGLPGHRLFGRIIDVIMFHVDVYLYSVQISRDRYRELMKDYGVALDVCFIPPAVTFLDAFRQPMIQDTYRLLNPPDIA